MADDRVLVVDDHSALLSSLRAVLETHGYVVTTSNSAADAKAWLAAGEFDLVLTDMKMETDHAGYDVARAAREKPERPAIAIMTAFPPLAEEWRQAGADGVLIKPTTMSDLLDTVRHLLSRRASSEDSRKVA